MLPFHAVCLQFFGWKHCATLQGGTHSGGYAWYTYGRLCLVHIRAAMPGTHSGGYAWYILARSMTECKRWEFCYKPCKNRHCPKCGAFEKAQWLEAQKIWLLPIHYYHVVFTIDHIFNPLVAFNQ